MTMRSRRRRLWSWVLQSILVSMFVSTAMALPEVIKVGGLFETNDDQQELAFRKAIEMINTDESKLPRTRLSAKVKRVAPQNSFRALKTACDFLEEGVAAVFGPRSPSNMGVSQSTCDTFEMPLLQTHWAPRTQARSHAINFFPESRTLAIAFTDFLIEQHWKSFTLIFEDNEALIRLQEILQQPTTRNIRVTLRHVKPDQDFKKFMKDLFTLRENNFVVDLPLPRIKQLFADADKVDMMTEYQNYLLTSLDVQTVEWNQNFIGRTNITAFRLIDPENRKFKKVLTEWIFSEQTIGKDVSSKQPIMTEAALLYDAVMMLTRALEDLDRSKPIELRSLYCDGTATWPDGTAIVNYMKIIPYEGTSGHIKIDKNGLRTTFTIDIVRITRKGIIKIGTWDPEHRVQYQKAGGSDISDFLDLLKNTTLRVTTVLTAPYMSLRLPIGDYIGNERYEGFCKDLVQRMADKYGFKYIITPVRDGKHGGPQKELGTWNGMIGELLRREADIAIGDLTITYSREQAVDFTMPFMNLGISILFKKPVKQNPPMFSFLKPLSLEVWFYMGTAYLGVSLFLFILARLSPYEWVNPHPCDIENDVVENQFTLLNSFWFTIGSIMQQGSDILPRAISTRIVASSWWFFTLIMISSYTANLAAFLTAQRMTSPIESAPDLAKQTTIKYGSVGGGSTMSFFKDSAYPIYKRMWSFMESQRPSVFAENNDKGIERVRMGNYAFLMESTTIEYIVERNCELTKVGGELDTKGYGIATPPGSPYRNLLSSAILELQETYQLRIMKDRWWKLTTDRCADDSGSTSAEMGIRNVGGVFLVLALGSCLGTILVVIEFVWKANKKLERESIPLMLWREFKSILQCRGSTRPTPKEPEEPSVEKMPMVNLSKMEEFKFS